MRIAELEAFRQCTLAAFNLRHDYRQGEEQQRLNQSPFKNPFDAQPFDFWADEHAIIYGEGAEYPQSTFIIPL